MPVGVNRAFRENLWCRVTVLVLLSVVSGGWPPPAPPARGSALLAALSLSLTAPPLMPGEPAAPLAAPRDSPAPLASGWLFVVVVVGVVVLLLVLLVVVVARPSREAAVLAPPLTPTADVKEEVVVEEDVEVVVTVPAHATEGIGIEIRVDDLQVFFFPCLLVE